MNLDDALILLQIELIRHDAHLQKEIAKRLNITRDELFGILAVSKIDGRNQKAITQKLQELISNRFNEVGEYLLVSLNDVMPVAETALVATYTQHLKKKIAQSNDYELPEIYGADVTEWIKNLTNKNNFAMKRFVSEMRDEKPLSEIADEVTRLFNRSVAETSSLARDARSVATGEMNVRILMKNKAVRLLQHKSHLDSGTTNVCRVRHNKRWRKDGDELVPVGHNLLFKAPPLHWGCRSIIKPLIEDDDSDDDYDIEDWLDSMPENIQDKALGKGKAKIWRKARIEGRKPFTIRDLLNQNGRELSLNEIGRLYDPNFIEPVTSTKIAGEVRFRKSHLVKKLKHYADFGGNAKSQKDANIKKYQSALINHLNDKNTIKKGYYYKGNGGDVYYNKLTNIVMVVDFNGYYSTNFMLVAGKNQYNLYMETGKLV